jgi:SAM-dependent methyltransferase
MRESVFEPASFRDRTSRVFYHDGAVFRGLNEHAWKEWRALSSTALFRRLTAEGKLIFTEQIDATATPIGSSPQEWSAVLRHEPIPFISYPYEWPFGMLKDAALLHLELLQAALEEEMILKDASPFNVQWKGAQPIFIDIPSFERLAPGEPWVGYRQFCQLFLYPLLLQAYKDIPFHPWLRGSLEGIAPEHCARLMSVRDLFRAGVFTHVYLQAKAQALYAHTSRNLKQEFRQAGFHKAVIQANLRRLKKLVQRLRWQRTTSAWADYDSKAPYSDSDHEQKGAFVTHVARSHSWRLVWDLGCNLGVFSRMVADHASYVVAIDADALVIERLYQALKAEKNRSILPLVNNLADPSPNLGWRGRERGALVERGKPDLVLCLALIHHMVIGNHIPLREFVDWLAEVAPALVIEFVTRDDPMVQTLLRHKADHYEDYQTGYFEHCLSERFVVVRREPLRSATRILYYATRTTP